MTQPFVHWTAEVESGAMVGEDTQVWRNVQIRTGARIGRNCILGKDVYIDVDVLVGDRVKIENGALLFRGSRIGDGVFIGPGVILTNDRLPRAIRPDGVIKTIADWDADGVTIAHGASIGAGAVIVAGISVGTFALVGAGAVVTRNVPHHALVVGNPARITGGACCCGTIARGVTSGSSFRCSACFQEHHVGG